MAGRIKSTRHARAAGLADAVIFAGQRPADEIPAFLDAADALVSPRSSGTNTPLKIYQYLRSGRPIVATRLLTHTQVLDDAVAYLSDATPEGFGAAILEALADPDRARAVGARARQLAETKYSYEATDAPARRSRCWRRARRKWSGAWRDGESSTPLPARDDHYSYATYADPHMAETFEAARFGGPIGRLLAETQEQVIAGFLSPLTARRSSTSAPAPVARRSRSPGGVPPSPASTHLPRCSPWPGAVPSSWCSGDVRAG